MDEKNRIRNLQCKEETPTKSRLGSWPQILKMKRDVHPLLAYYVKRFFLIKKYIQKPFKLDEK